MKKKYVYIVLLPVLFLLIYSCEREITWNINNVQDFLVIDAIITNEYKTHEINIQGFTGEMNVSPVPLSNVEIKLTVRNDTIYFTESDEQLGLYLSENPFRAAGNQTYELTIAWRDFHDTAYATMAPIDDFQALAIVEYDSLYKIQYIPATLPSMMDVFYDWSANTAYCGQNNACQAWETFYTLNTIDIQKEFAPEKEVITFPRQTTIIRRKYSLSEAHQDFLRSLLIETQWRGGLFDIEQGNVPSNFRYGARGWFSVCMVQGDTTFFD